MGIPPCQSLPKNAGLSNFNVRVQNLGSTLVFVEGLKGLKVLRIKGGHLSPYWFFQCLLSLTLGSKGLGNVYW